MESYTFFETKQHSPLYIRKIQPGCPLTVQVKGDSQLRFTSHLIGYEIGSYLLLALPVNVRKYFQSNLLMGGAAVVVRLLLEGEDGKCLAFHSHIESSMTHPHDFLFLSFPRKIESCELRKYPRLSTCMTASLLNNEQNEYLEGRMKDVSLGGCRFCFEMPNNAKSVNYKKIDFLLGPKDHPVIRFPAEIRSQRMVQGMMQVGIKFDGDEISNERRLIQLHIDRDALLGA